MPAWSGPQALSADEGRSRFAEALGRKHDRFAFPDTFNDHVLAKLRKWIVEAHGKVTSENGKAYRSIQIGRVTANPHRTGSDLVATFHFILVPKDEREVTRTQIAKTLGRSTSERSRGRLGFRATKPLYTMEEMTAAEWKRARSQPIDWDFISSAGKVVGAVQA